MLKKVLEDFCLNHNCEVKGIAGSVVEWLKRRARDQHGLSSKTTRAILLCP